MPENITKIKQFPAKKRIRPKFPGDTFSLSLIILTIFILFIAGCVIVDDKDSSGKSATDSKTLTISGSTTIQPVSELLAAAYMNEHPDVDIVVKGGGSSVGIEESGKKIVDIGSASREVKDSELEQYPDMKVHQIGASAVVIITSQMNDIETITYEEVRMLYNNLSEDISLMPDIQNVDTVIQRSEDSGTEEIFSGWLFSGMKNVDFSLTARDKGLSGEVVQLSGQGNAEVLNLVKENQNSIGFLDFGYAESDPGVKILKIKDKNSEDALPLDTVQIREDILKELWREKSGDDESASYYVPGLIRPLNYVTTGEVSSLAGDFINFASGNSSKAYFNEIGYFSVAELNGEI